MNIKDDVLDKVNANSYDDDEKMAHPPPRPQRLSSGLRLGGSTSKGKKRISFCTNDIGTKVKTRQKDTKSSIPHKGIHELSD